MCLSLKILHPNDVLAEGTHLGFEWAVIHNGMGYRCGYIKVEPGHPWYKQDYNDVEASCHGGLTFGESDTPCTKGGLDDGFWFGFDCAHGGDAPDPKLPREVKDTYGLSRFGVVRSQLYVEEQCRSLCEQAKRAMEVSCQ